MSGSSEAGPRRVGVRQVAERAGVSTQTVSRVLNGHPHIRAQTRERVLAAMAELDYRVNNAARSLGTRSTRTIGVIASDAALYGPATTIAALETAARAAGRWVATAYADAGDRDSVAEAAAHLLGQGVDGIVLVALRSRAREAVASRAGGIPVVPFSDAEGIAAQHAGSALAVEHLVALGHRRIARLGGPAPWPEEKARAAGFAAALAAHELAPAAAWRGDWSAASGAARAVEVAASVGAAGGPTAVVTANDQMALGLMAGLFATGLSVPDDVSIVGFDDNPDAASYRPALTTVRLDLAAQARRSIAAVLGAGAGDAAPEDAAVASPALAVAELVVRASTAAPAR